MSLDLDAEPDGIVKVQLMRTPPSLNAVGSRGGHHAWSKEKKALQGEVGMLMLAHAGLHSKPGVKRKLARVEASAVLQFRKNARRDEGNFRVMLEKVVGDALVTLGFLRDDTPDEYSFKDVRFAIVKDQPQKSAIELKFWEEQ